MRLGVLSNTQSRRNRRFFGTIRDVLATAPGVPHESVDSVDVLPRALDRLLDTGADVLAVNGGDGTVSAVLTELFLRRTLGETPTLAILAGGTSNTIAADCGFGRDPVTDLLRLLALRGAGGAGDRVDTRPVLRVRYAAAAAPVAGMFFGTAAISDAVLLRRRMFPQTWIPDAAAAAATLVYVLASAAIGRTSVLAGRDIGLRLDRRRIERRAYSVMMLTTLNRIVLGAAPFWAATNGAIKVTTIASPPRHLVRHAFRLLYGRDRDRLPDATFRSYTADDIELEMDCPFVLDGEFFEPAPAETVAVGVAGMARFLRPPPGRNA